MADANGSHTRQHLTMSSQSLLCTALLLWSTVTLGQGAVGSTKSPSTKPKINGRVVERLLQHIKNSTLDKAIIPFDEDHQTIHVKFGLSLQHIDSLDETKGNIQLLVWMRYIWKDYYLKWDPQDFNDTHLIRMPLEYLWSPDIVLYNKKKDTVFGTVNAIASADGTVMYIPPAQLTGHCDMDFTYFPFDTQTCSLKFGSWIYDGDVVSLGLYTGEENIDLEDYSANKEWDLVGTIAKHQIKYYSCCPEPYPSITFNLTISRKTSYYTYVYVGPAVVLSLLVPFIFLLPPGDPQKMTLGGSILICFTLFFMEMSMALPTIHSHTPLIDQYYMTIYVLLCAAMALSTLISNIARRSISMKHPPDFVEKVMLSCLGRCLCVSQTMYTDMIHDDEDINQVQLTKGDSNHDLQKAPIRKWFLIATVIDRLFFLVYIVLTVVLTIIILSCRG